MKTLYYFLLLFSVAFGFNVGLAGFSWTKWILMPILAILFGAFVRFFWGD